MRAKFDAESQVGVKKPLVIGPRPAHPSADEGARGGDFADTVRQLQRGRGNRYVQQMFRSLAGGGTLTAEADDLGPASKTSEASGAHSAEPGAEASPMMLAGTTGVYVSPATVPRHTELSGGIVGGLVGAGIGAGIGALVGGPIGALAGGLIGGVIGTIIGAIVGRRGPIGNATVQAAMRQAWADSDAGSAANRHEEGGYIVRNADNSLGVARWPRGAGAAIQPPARDGRGRFGGLEVLGEFHTHPNPPVDEAGRRWTPGPSPTDITGIRAERYPGDSYVVSAGEVFVVHSDGSVDTV